MAGVEDFAMSDIGFLPDPCALPEQRKNKKEQLVYVPFSGVGRVLYDKDAIYVDLGGSHGFQAQLWSLTLLPIQRQAQYTMGTVKEMVRQHCLYLCVLSCGTLLRLLWTILFLFSIKAQISQLSSTHLIFSLYLSTWYISEGTR
nr:uncharacterized protein LOC103215797 isoform X2 [Chlorocebus sabaeus]